MVYRWPQITACGLLTTTYNNCCGTYIPLVHQFGAWCLSSAKIFVFMVTCNEWIHTLTVAVCTYIHTQNNVSVANIFLISGYAWSYIYSPVNPHTIMILEYCNTRYTYAYYLRILPHSIYIYSGVPGYVIRCARRHTAYTQNITRANSYLLFLLWRMP